MKSISKSIKCLEAAGYLRAKVNSSEGDLNSVELLEYAKRYSAELKQHWINARKVNFTLKDVDIAGKMDKSRLTFAHTEQFRHHLKHIHLHQNVKCPTIVRYQELNSSSTSTDKLFNYKAPITHLITDFFVNSRRGLEHFYNIQRESKIWWMRYSSNPSRYFLDPHEFDVQVEGAALTKHCQSITIKSRLPGGVFEVESLTMLPLNEAMLTNEDVYYMKDMRSNKDVLPTVIRSVIQQEPAACALLLDANDHSRKDTLLLHRKLAPYQCGIVCLLKANTNEHILRDLKDLWTHFAYVLHKAGLRLANEKDNTKNFFNNSMKLQKQLQNYDKLGVPYTLLFDETTLENGICKLRSRDTTLAETIHISDIPEYLLNIFIT